VGELKPEDSREIPAAKEMAEKAGKKGGPGKESVEKKTPGTWAEFHRKKNESGEATVCPHSFKRVRSENDPKEQYSKVFCPLN